MTSISASAGSCASSCSLQFCGERRVLQRPAPIEAHKAATLVGGIDHEDARVVERVVLRLAVVVREIDAEVQRPVGERRTVDVVTQRQRTGVTSPPEPSGRDLTGGGA